MDYQSKTLLNKRHSNLTLDLEKKKTIKQDYQYIISDFFKSPQKNSEKQFYQRIPSKHLQQIINLIFKYNNPTNNQKHRKLTANFIIMLKTGIGFSDYVAEHKQFNKLSLFQFLSQTPIDENILSVFGQIFITLARNSPCNILSILQDEDVQNILIRNLKKFQIFTLIYTAIFCLNPLQSQQFSEFIKFAFHALLRTPFEDNQGESLFPCYCSYLQSSPHNQQQLKQQQIPQNQPTQTPEQNHQSHQNHKTPHKTRQHDKKLSYRKDTKINDHHYFLNQQNVDFYLQIIQTCQNISTMLHQISFNIDVINIQNVLILINQIQTHSYIDQLFKLLTINQKSQRPNKYDLTAFLLKILFQIIKLYLSMNTIKKTITSNPSLKKMKSSTQNKFQALTVRKYDSIQNLLKISQYQFSSKKNQKQINCTQIYSDQIFNICTITIECLHSYLLYINHEKFYYEQSSGLKIENIGLIKYWILKLHLQFLKILQNTHTSLHSQYPLKLTFPFLLPLIQQCLVANRWNNIIQKLIAKIFKLYLQNCYQDFYKAVIDIQKPCQGFLAFLIQLFRNKYHIYLNSMKFTTQGDRHIIFQLCQYISIQLHINKDLLTLFKKFPQWKQFMLKDLIQYQKTFIDNQYFNIKMLQILKQQKNIQLQSSPNKKSIQQLVQLYQNCWIMENNKSKHMKLKTKNIIQNYQLSTDFDQQMSNLHRFKHNTSL